MSLAPNQLLTWPVVLAAWLTLIVITLALTARERRISAAPWTRWIGVTLFGTAAVISPLLWAMILGESWFAGIITATEDTLWSPFGEVRTTRLAVSGITATVGTIMLWKLLLTWMRPERAMLQQKGALPEVENESLRARVIEIAAAMGVGVPRVLKLGLHSEKTQALAWASGALRPVVVVTDGLLHRLSANERDAVVAHEVGHIAQRTIWIYLSVVLGAWWVALACSIWVPIVISLLLGLYLTMVGLRIVGHWSEPDCDLRGARVIGHAAMANALDKVHATAGIDQSHRLAAWVHATQTHPSMIERAERLFWDAPEEERAEIEHHSEDAARHRRVNRLAVLFQLLIAAAAIYFGRNQESQGTAFFCLLIGLLTPVLLMVGVGFSAIADYFRLGMARFPWVSLARFASIVAGLSGPIIALMLKEDERSGGEHRNELLWFETSAMFYGVGVVGVLLFILLGRSRRKVGKVLALALRERRYDDAVAAIDAGSPRLRRDPLMRYQRALSLALGGHLDGGLAEAEQLLEDHPKLGVTVTLVAALKRGKDTEGVLRMIEEKQRMVPVWWYFSVRAGLLRRLGRLDESMEAAVTACEKAPNKGVGWQMRAWTELERGDFEAAEEALDIAEPLDPGSATSSVIRLALAIARGDGEEAIDAAIARARELSKVNPLGFLDLDIDELESAFRANRAGMTD